MKASFGLFIVLALGAFPCSPVCGQEEDAAPTLPLAKPFAYSPAQLEVWNDPHFQQRFIESYLSETEIEPKISPEDVVKMQEVLALIQPATDDEEGETEEKELTEEEKAAKEAELGANIQKAVELLTEYRIDGSAVFDFTLGNIHFQREEFNQALVAYEEAIRKHPKFRRAWRNMAMIYVRQGEYKKAVPTLIRVIELGGGDGILYGLLGYSHSMNGDDLPAESAYRQAVLLDPKTQDWKMGMARSFFKQKRYAEAAALCQMMLESEGQDDKGLKNRDKADLWLLQANAFIGLNKPLQAAENYELVKGLGHATPASLNMLGDIYVNEEIFDQAVACYLKALEMKPTASPDRAIRAARVMTARGALKETKALVAKLEKIKGDQLKDNDRKEMLKLRSRIAVAEGAGDEEAKILEEIVKLDPQDGEALILLGKHSQRKSEELKQTAAATEDKDQAKKIDRQASDRLAKAVFYFERAAAIDKFEADAKVQHATLLVGQRKYQEALPLLRRAQSIKPRENIQRYLEQVERIAKSR